MCEQKGVREYGMNVHMMGDGATGLAIDCRQQEG